MLTTSKIRVILADVDFGDWEFYVGDDVCFDSGGRKIQQRPWLQVRFDASDLITGEPERQHGRKWFLSPHMTKSEVVSTAFKAVLTAIEHEAREQFRYRGRAIFGPHFDVDQLVAFAADRENVDMRTGAWVAAA